jgi:hypothetical protein
VAAVAGGGGGGLCAGSCVDVSDRQGMFNTASEGALSTLKQHGSWCNSCCFSLVAYMCQYPSLLEILCFVKSEGSSRGVSGNANARRLQGCRTHWICGWDVDIQGVCDDDVETYMP